MSTIGSQKIRKLMKIDLFGYNIHSIDSYYPAFIHDTKFIPRQESQTSIKEDLSKIQSKSIFYWDSPNSTKSSNFTRVEKHDEQVKSEEFDDCLTTPKNKYTRMNIHLRKDVVNKSIIRAFGRFYNKHFTFEHRFFGNTKKLLDSIPHQQVEDLITSSINYQEHFDMGNEKGPNSKLTILVDCY